MGSESRLDISVTRLGPARPRLQLMTRRWIVLDGAVNARAVVRRLEARNGRLQEALHAAGREIRDLWLFVGPWINENAAPLERRKTEKRKART